MTPPPKYATPEVKTRILEIVGVFLFYARAIDCTMLTTVNKLASKRAYLSPLIAVTFSTHNVKGVHDIL